MVFFARMPTMIQWCQEASKHFTFKDHITWIKRTGSNPFADLLNTHEEILIYRKGKPSYFETKGRYTDLKVEGVYFNTYNIESIKRYIASLHYTLKNGGKQAIKKRSIHSNAKELFKTDPSDFLMNYEDCNFTTVWSFLPHNKSSFNHSKTEHNDEHNIKHPTVKPAKLMERLIRLTSSKDDLILDPFLGSGTTAVVCEQLKRKWIGIEIDPEYSEIAKRRLQGLQPYLFA